VIVEDKTFQIGDRVVIHGHDGSAEREGAARIGLGAV
jgi:hypothetical protein